MAKVTFVTQSSRSADNIGYSPERLINFYPEVGPEGQKGPLLLRSVLGQESFATLPIARLRAAEVINNVIYAVGAGRLFSITPSGTISDIGAVDDDVVTTISGNDSNVTIACGGNYYVWDGSALSHPSGGAFTGEGTVAFIDNRTIITEKDAQQWEWTDIAAPASRNALNFTENASKNDNTLRVLADKSYLLFFGEQSIEFYYNTGQSGPDAFQRINGGALETGLLGAMLAVKMPTGVFFISDDGLAYMTQGLSLQPISTPAVNQAIEAETPTNCFYYEDRGHKFCVVRFATRPAWVYDLTTGLWHERSTGVAQGPWEAVNAIKVAGIWYCGTDGGTFYKMARNNKDVNHPLKRVAVSRSIYLDGKKFSVPELEILGRVGESNLSDFSTMASLLYDTSSNVVTDAFGEPIYTAGFLARAAQMVLRISRDGGTTWEAERARSMGDIGDRTQKIIWHGNGRGEEFTIEVSITDPAELTLYSAANVRVA